MGTLPWLCLPNRGAYILDHVSTLTARDFLELTESLEYLLTLYCQIFWS